MLYFENDIDSKDSKISLNFTWFFLNKVVCVLDKEVRVTLQ